MTLDDIIIIIIILVIAELVLIGLLSVLIGDLISRISILERRDLDSYVTQCRDANDLDKLKNKLREWLDDDDTGDE